MILAKWRILLALGCAALLISTISACSGSEITPTPVALVPIAYSPLPTPTVAPVPTQDESLIFIRPNGDVVLYTLADRRATTLLEEAYFFGDGELLGGNEIPLFHVINFPLLPSPDGKWLLVPTPDQGTWLVAMDGSTQRQISPTILGATWAPDSQQIAYTGFETGAANAPEIRILYTHNIVAGGEPRALLKSEASIFRPVWSPGCDTVPAPAGRSCGQHIFVFMLLDNNGNDPHQVTLVDVATGQVKTLGPYKGPAREIAPSEFKWSPAGDEFWAPGTGFAGVNAVAFPIDGTTPRPLVSACASGCANERRSGEVQTSGGWTILYGRTSYNEEIYAQSPTGEQIEIASDAYFAGTLAQLRSTEVGQSAEIVPLPTPSHPSLWNERTLLVGIRYRFPPEWDESGADWEKGVRNYRFAEAAGMASLGSTQLTIQFETRHMSGNPGEALRRWLDANDAEEGMALDQPLPGVIANDYDAQVYQVKGEVVTVGNRPAIRLHSDLFPFAEKIVVPLKYHKVEIAIWPRPSTQDPVLDEILASIVLPSPEGEAVVILHDTGLYDGPGLEYQRLGTADIGNVIDIVAQDETGDWLQLREGLWVEAQRIEEIPPLLPIASAPKLPTPIAPSPLATP